MGSIFHFYSTFDRIFGKPDQILLFAASDLGLYCLPMSHKKDARLTWVNIKKDIRRRLVKKLKSTNLF